MSIFYERLKKANEEIDRLRAENVDLRKQIIGKDTQIQDLENEANNLRAERDGNRHAHKKQNN